MYKSLLQHPVQLIYNRQIVRVGRDSVIGIASRYKLDGPGTESRWGLDFWYLSRQPWDPPSLLYKGHWSNQGMALTTLPHLVPTLKSRAIPLLPLWAFMACSWLNFTFCQIIRMSDSKVWVEVIYNFQIKLTLHVSTRNKPQQGPVYSPVNLRCLKLEVSILLVCSITSLDSHVLSILIKTQWSHL